MTQFKRPAVAIKYYYCFQWKLWWRSSNTSSNSLVMVIGGFPWLVQYSIIATNRSLQRRSMLRWSPYSFIKWLLAYRGWGWWRRVYWSQWCVLYDYDTFTVKKANNCNCWHQTNARCSQVIFTLSFYGAKNNNIFVRQIVSSFKISRQLSWHSRKPTVSQF